MRGEGLGIGGSGRDSWEQKPKAAYSLAAERTMTVRKTCHPRPIPPEVPAPRLRGGISAEFGKPVTIAIPFDFDNGGCSVDTDFADLQYNVPALCWPHPTSPFLLKSAVF